MLAPAAIRDLIDQGAIFYCSHSGGKDSQAMWLYLREVIPAGRLRLIHADLGDIEHAGTKAHIEATTEGWPLLVAKAQHADGTPATFFSLVRRRRAKLDRDGKLDAPAFPANGPARFCTSDLKTGPIWRDMKRDLRDTDHRIIVNCVGIRSDESTSRKTRLEKHGPLRFNSARSNGRWDCWDWNPISDWTTAQVFDYIASKGQEPHPAYAEGNDRLSCVFCIFGSPNDHRLGRQKYPHLFRRYEALELEVRTTMFNGASIRERLDKPEPPQPPEQADLFSNLETNLC